MDINSFFRQKNTKTNFQGHELMYFESNIHLQNDSNGKKLRHILDPNYD